MKIGEKIREARRSLNLTQEQLSGDKITRNMLSAIECDKASPSLQTLEYLCSRLNIPIAYLLTDEADLFIYRKSLIMKDVRTLYSEAKFQELIELISSLGDIDDELAYVLSIAHLKLGRRSVLTGALVTAKFHLSSALEYANKTVFDTSSIEMLVCLYSALCENIQSPMLELDAAKYEKYFYEITDVELFKYVSSDPAYIFKDENFAKHRDAKDLMKNRKYTEAMKLLSEIEKNKNPDTYNAHLMFMVYTDMEACAKQLMDFESAYKYASRRLSMIEGFKT